MVGKILQGIRDPSLFLTELSVKTIQMEVHSVSILYDTVRYSQGTLPNPSANSIENQPVMKRFDKQKSSLFSKFFI